MKRNILKKVLLGAAIVGSVSFGTNAVFADTVDVSSFGELQTAIKNATAATTINILNDITDIDKDMKLLDQDIVIEGSWHSFVSKGDHVGMDITGEGSDGSFTRPSSLTIKNATVKDFKKTNGWGSAIYNDGILTLENVNFENNHNYGSGSKAGAITNNRSGVATISGNILPTMAVVRFGMLQKWKFTQIQMQILQNLLLTNQIKAVAVLFTTVAH